MVSYDLFSLYLYHFGCSNFDFKCFYTLDYIAALIRSPMYALHGLAVRAIQRKVLFSSRFAEEPNVADNVCMVTRPSFKDETC